MEDTLDICNIDTLEDYETKKRRPECAHVCGAFILRPFFEQIHFKKIAIYKTG